MTQAVQSIGAGPYEFPISGSFSFRHEGGATVLTTSNQERQITVGFFRKMAAMAAPTTKENIVSVETLVRGNWERFASQEKGKIVRSFKRTDLTPTLAVFSMSTEFLQQGKVQYYVQYAVTDGLQTASLFIEGFGPAATVVTEIEPLIMRVKLTDTSNSSLQVDAQKSARP
jgi:hypothetical protein